jgi:two-component system phosphate regulon response regulator OmpR
MEHVLVIDDNQQIRNLLKTFLEKEGYQVSVADNGDSAITLCKSIQFDLIIADIIMPGKSGIDFIKEFTALSPAAKIIAISGGETAHYFTSTMQLNTAVYSGAIRSLKKPFKLTELLAAIKEVLTANR